MTPRQQAQKDKARADSERDLDYSAMERQRDDDLIKYGRSDAISNSITLKNAEAVRDANNAYAGQK
jgi:hypothetical protein